MNSMIKKLGLVVTMFLSIISATAYDFEVDGIYYQITSSSNLEVEVTYNPSRLLVQELYDNGWYDGVRKNITYSGSVSIPSTVNYNNRTYTVTAIGSYAFGSDDTNREEAHYFPGTYYGEHYGDNYGSNITSVVIPSTIKKIKTGAFRFCTKLINVEFSEGLIEIEEQAFKDCPLSELLRFPNTLTRIGSQAFMSCDNVKTLFLNGSQLNSVLAQSFSSCVNLSYVMVGANVTTLYGSSFNYCSKLLELYMLPISRPAFFSRPAYCHQYLEIYVPSLENYGFGKEYLSIQSNSFDYTGQPHVIEWSNNLRAYKCDILESECVSEINAGTYTKNISATYSSFNEDEFVVTIPVKYSINKVPLSFTIFDSEREYGDANPMFDFLISGFVNGETIHDIGSSPVFECEATQYSSVGQYKIIASLSASNYEITYKYGTLNILKAPLILKAVDAKRIYGNDNPSFQLEYTGLKNGETSVNWLTPPDVCTPATKTSSVGVYDIAVSGGIAVNYEPNVYVPGNLIIQKAPLIATIASVSKKYGDLTPEFTLTYNGLKNGEETPLWSITPILSTDASMFSDVGEYVIKAEGGDAVNYDVQFKEGILYIIKAPLSVAVENCSRIYGDSNPTFNLVYVGLKNNEKEPQWSVYPTVETSATKKSEVGSYSVYAKQGEALNYNLSFNEGILTIAKANLYIDVKEETRKVGEPNPKFELLFDGFKNDDDEHCLNELPIATTNATLDSPAGIYEITLSGGLDKNYEYILDSGTLTIIEDSGIESVLNDDLNVKVFTLSGLYISDSISNLSSGIYIIKRGHKTEKIVLK